MPLDEADAIDPEVLAKEIDWLIGLGSKRSRNRDGLGGNEI